MNYPEYIEVNGKKYKINTDFRVALECNQIALDDTINDTERALAIIYKLLGEEALNDFENHEKMLSLIKLYLNCGKEEETQSNEEPDMDFEQDMDLIRISFMTDYNGLDIKNTNMHFWEFIERINGLSNSEMGNCCLLNRVRNLRNYDPKDIKDPKEKRKIIEAKQRVALKKHKKYTEEEKKNIDEFMKLAGIKRK